MDLLDRYIAAVRSYLPRNRQGAQDDIVQELSANIRDEMDDRANALGRPLSEDEQEAILQRHGHPMLVAGRYRTDQDGLVFGRQLIGPALFPFYVRTLWIVIGASLAIRLIVVFALGVAGVPVADTLSLDSFLLQIIIPFVVLTAIFTVADQSLPALRWSARSLPAPLPAPVARHPNQVSRLESIAQIIALVVVLFWLKALLDNPALIFGPAAAHYHLGPVWSAVALPTALILLAGVVQAAVNLARPDWVLVRQVTRLGTDLATLAVVIYLLLAGQWVISATPGSGSAALQTINQWVFYGLLCPAIALALVTLWDAWKLLRGARPSRKSAALAA